MAPRLLFVVATICFYLSYFIAEGRIGRLKDVMKTIKTEDGVYDCFDFYKQPSLQHPLLKNHSFHHEMRPSITHTTITMFKEDESMVVNHNVLDCPKGTVPIRRLSKEDRLFQTQLRREHYAHLGGIRPNNNDGQSSSIANFAIAQSNTAITNEFYAIDATLSVHNPPVTADQYSSAEIIIRGGTDVIITGWTVNPMVYKDNRTRIFTYVIAGESHCFNSACGFVQVNPHIALDAGIMPVSKVFGEIFIYPFLIYKDPGDKNWWLRLGWNNTLVGFWPRDIFKGLYESGDYVACGAEVYGPSNVDNKILGYPQMGWGIMPSREMAPNKWPHCRDIRVRNQDFKPIIYRDLETYTSDHAYYFVALSTDNDIAAYGGPHPSIYKL